MYSMGCCHLVTCFHSTACSHSHWGHFTSWKMLICAEAGHGLLHVCLPSHNGFEHTPLCYEDQGMTGRGLHTLGRSTFGLGLKGVFNLNLPTLVFVLFFVCVVLVNIGQSTTRGCLPHIGSQNKNVL